MRTAAVHPVVGGRPGAAGRGAAARGGRLLDGRAAGPGIGALAGGAGPARGVVPRSVRPLVRAHRGRAEPDAPTGPHPQPDRQRRLQRRAARRCRRRRAQPADDARLGHRRPGLRRLHLPHQPLGRRVQAAAAGDRGGRPWPAPGEDVSPQVQTASLIAGAGSSCWWPSRPSILVSARGRDVVGRVLESAARRALRLVGPAPRARLVTPRCSTSAASAPAGRPGVAADVRRDRGVRRTAGTAAAAVPAPHRWRQHLAARCSPASRSSVPSPSCPITPGGVGVADLGLVGVLLALGGDPVSVTGAAVLYRAFIFAVEIPRGQRSAGSLVARPTPVDRTPPGDATPPVVPPRRIAHVTDVFLPRLGGIETHVDDLARHQRAVGLDVEVLTPSRDRRRRPRVGEAPPGQAGPTRRDSSTTQCTCTSRCSPPTPSAWPRGREGRRAGAGHRALHVERRRRCASPGRRWRVCVAGRWPGRP